MYSVAVVDPPGAGARAEIVTWSPLFTDPGAVAAGPPLMLYVPPTTSTGAAASIPLTVIGAEVASVYAVTDCGAKENGSGTMSGTL